jgi:hypothetical protein
MENKHKCFECEYLNYAAFGSFGDPNIMCDHQQRVVPSDRSECLLNNNKVVDISEVEDNDNK